MTHELFSIIEGGVINLKEYKELVCYRLRTTAQEFGQKSVENAVVLGSWGGIEQVGGNQYMYCPTIAGLKLANCEYKVARFFEDL